MRRLAALAMLLLACEPRRVTQIVIRVQATDASTRARIDAVSLRVTRVGGDTIFDATFPPAGQRLPGEVGVIPRDASDARALLVEARAHLRDGEALAQVAEVRFTESHRTLLVLDFHAGCAALRCGADTCDADPDTGLPRCRARVRALTDYDPARDASTRDTLTPLDATDATDAMALDAATPDVMALDAPDAATPDVPRDLAAAPDDAVPDAMVTDVTDVADASDGGALRVVRVACGAGHCCEVTARDRVYCWGANNEGQVGNGLTSTTPGSGEATPVRDAVQVATGTAHSCALDRAGRVWCWGRGSAGQLGRGDTASSTEPAQALVDDVVDLSTRDEHVCVVRRDGTVWCWGAARGIVFVRPGTSPGQPTQIPIPSGRSARRVWAGYASSCALLDDHTATCWGDGSVALGDGSELTTGRMAPFRGPCCFGEVTSMSLSRDGGCARHISGGVSCWGRNALGQVGDGTTTPHLTPDYVTDPEGEIVDVVTGDSHACVLFRSTTVSCWGTDRHGQLGQGTVGVARLRASPVARVGLATSLLSGDETVCARRDDGTLQCWGRNDHGQIVFGTTDDHADAVTRPPLPMLP